MDSISGYHEVAKFAETNTTHPQRVIIAYHIRCGQYDLALEMLAGDGSSEAPDETEKPNAEGYPELQMMIEHLRKVETPIEEVHET